MTDTVHWIAGESSLIWNNPIVGVACGAEDALKVDRADYVVTKVTCEACLSVVMRRRCLALEDRPGPLPARCTLEPHVGLHSWEVQAKDTVLTHERCAQLRAEEVGVLPVRVPGAAMTEGAA